MVSTDIPGKVSAFWGIILFIFSTTVWSTQSSCGQELGFQSVWSFICFQLSVITRTTHIQSYFTIIWSILSFLIFAGNCVSKGLILSTITYGYFFIYISSSVQAGWLLLWEYYVVFVVSVKTMKAMCKTDMCASVYLFGWFLYANMLFLGRINKVWF